MDNRHYMVLDRERVRHCIADKLVGHFLSVRRLRFCLIDIYMVVLWLSVFHNKARYMIMIQDKGIGLKNCLPANIIGFTTSNHVRSQDLDSTELIYSDASTHR